MGLFWDLIQQGQISDQKSRSESLEWRVQNLEQELAQTRRLLQLLLERLENVVGEDLNRDGKVG